MLITEDGWALLHLEGHLVAVRQLTSLLLLQYSHRVPSYPTTHNRTGLWACRWPWTFYDTAREMDSGSRINPTVTPGLSRSYLNKRFPSQEVPWRGSRSSPPLRAGATTRVLGMSRLPFSLGLPAPAGRERKEAAPG